MRNFGKEVVHGLKTLAQLGLAVLLISGCSIQPRLTESKISRSFSGKSLSIVLSEASGKVECLGGVKGEPTTESQVLPYFIAISVTTLGHGKYGANTTSVIEITNSRQAPSVKEYVTNGDNSLIHEETLIKEITSVDGNTYVITYGEGRKEISSTEASDADSLFQEAYLGAAKNACRNYMQ